MSTSKWIPKMRRKHYCKGCCRVQFFRDVTKILGKKNEHERMSRSWENARKVDTYRAQKLSQRP